MLILVGSSGVGRTGIFIAVDRLLQQMENEDKIDVFNTVVEMMNHRNHIIKNEVSICSSF
jgi:cadherin 5 type 2 (VE-cadherin)